MTVLLLLACAGGSPDSAPDSAPADTVTDSGMTEREVPLDGACTADTRLGGFALTLTDQSLFTGYVATAPDPEAAETELAHVSDCFLFSHPPSCEPACEAGESCQSGTCVAAAPAMDLGAVTLEGVASPVAVSPTDGQIGRAHV